MQRNKCKSSFAQKRTARTAAQEAAQLAIPSSHTRSVAAVCRAAIAPFLLFCIVVCTLICVLFCTGCSGDSASETTQTKRLIKSVTYETIDDFDLDGKTIAVVTGTIYGPEIEKRYPSAKISYYTAFPDAFTALQGNKVDAIIYDEPIVVVAANEKVFISATSESLIDTDIAFGFPKKDESLPLIAQVNDYLADLEEDGTLDVLRTKWLSGDVAGLTVDIDYTKLPATNGTLVLGISSVNTPFEFFSEGKIVGYEIEIVFSFCEKYGYAVEILDSNFDGALASVSAGKCDIAACDFSITEERKKNIYFSSPTVNVSSPLVYLSNDEDLAAINTPITDLDSLSGKRIGVVAKSAAASVASGVAGKLGDVKFYAAAFDLAQALSDGKIDAYICDADVCEQMCSANSSHVILDEKIGDGTLARVILSSAGNAGGSWIDGVVEGFDSTFITENRWQMFLTGIFNTLIITIASLILGTILGYLLYLLCRNGGRIANGFVDFCVWLITGMPVVVLLMILFYIIFGRSPISEVAVAVIGFTLIFATSVIGMLKTGVSAVDEGQEEAASILGYSREQIFRLIVLPQAIRHVLPLYKGEIVTLLKATAIVGYIAVQDLTKVGDIIRSRTFEAFFPLLAVAIIYFVLAALLKLFMKVLLAQTSLENRSQEKILKGINPNESDETIAQKTRSVTADNDSGGTGNQGPLVQIRHMQKSYGSVTPIRDFNADINKGEVISVIGPSGCGKSTLFRCITLLDPPTAGQVIVSGEDITAPGYDMRTSKLRMGMVFQKFNLFAHWTVIENVMNPQITLLGRSRQEAYDESCRLLSAVGMLGKLFSYPSELSGGQQQRVAIARTLGMNPDIILFDEPTSALDPTSVSEVQRVIRNLSDEGRTMMIVTHEMRFAREVCNRVFYMDEGGLYEEGSPVQVFGAPVKELTKKFMRRMRIVDVAFMCGAPDFPSVTAAADLLRNRYSLPFRVSARLDAAVEELCRIALIPRLSKKDRMRIEFDYDAQRNEVIMTVDYTGPELNPLDSDDAISLAMIKWLLHSINFSFGPADSDGFTNHVQAILNIGEEPKAR